MRKIDLNFKILLSTLICVVSFSNLLSQDRDTVLKEVIFSTEKRVSPSKQSAPVQVMDKSRIENLAIKDLHEAVRTFSGASIKDYGGVGGVKSVSIRNLGSQHTAVSYDGVTISNAQSGQIDIGRFSTYNVEEISLTIGQSDNIFQPARNFASSGILNIKSLAPNFKDKNINIAVNLIGGSFDLLNPSIVIEGKLNNNWRVGANGDWLYTDGVYPFKLTNGQLVTDETRENSDVNRIRGEVNLYGKIGKSGNLSIKGSYLDSERGLPGSIILYNTEANERLWDKNGFLNVNYSNDFSSKWSFTTAFKYSYDWNRYVDISSIYQDGKIDDKYTQQEYYVTGGIRYRPLKNLTFTLSQDLFHNGLVATTPKCANPDRITSMSALAGQYLTDRLTVTASLLGLYNTEWVEYGDASSDKKRISPALGVSYKLFSDKNIRVRASVKDGYRVPTFNDLYYVRSGNRVLNPEKALQINAGFTFADKFMPSLLDFLSFSVDGYYNRISDKIVAMPTMFIWSMINLGEVQMFGTDVNISTNFFIANKLNFNISGNYSYQYAIDITNSDSKNYKHQIPYTPRHSGNLIISCLNDWVDIGYTVSFVGDRYSLPQNIVDNKMEEYIEQNISLSRNFNISNVSITVQGEILNLGNVMYDVIQYYPMPGRNYRVSIKLKY